LAKKEALLPLTTFTVMPTNAKVGKKLGSKTATGKKKLSCSTAFGKTEFTVNVKILQIQTMDPKVAIPNFWFLPAVMIWATGLKMPMKHWCDAHITWNAGAKTMGKGQTNAPSLTGNIYVKVTDIMGKKTVFGQKIGFAPYQNKVTF
jgi:hypothetical protein